ncbi:MAG TPA: hypothetical protein VGD53_10715 [Actinoallomurus sp.]
MTSIEEGPNSGGAAPTDRSSTAGPDPRSSGLRQLGKILGSIVAPTTLVTSLLYYFGWSFTFSFFDNFGVSYTVVDLGTVEYLQRAVVALYLPAAVLASVALLVLWCHAALRARLAAGSDPRLIRVLILVAAATGFGLSCGGFLSLFHSTVLTRYVTVAPLSLAAGVLLLASALHLQRTRTARKLGNAGRAALGAVAEWAIVFALVGLGLFWAAGDYSVAVANTQAYKYAQELPTSPGLVLYSGKSLSLNAPGVQQTRCKAADAAYHYRYDGLKLMMRSGDQYLFVTERWTRENGVAILIPRSDSMRLEFAPSSNQGIAAHPAC